MILYSNLFTIIKNPEVLLISKLVFSFDDSFLDSPSSQGQHCTRSKCKSSLLATRFPVSPEPSPSIHHSLLTH